MPMGRAKELPGRRPYVPEADKMVAHNFTIHPRHMALLKERAAAQHVPLSVVLRDVLDRWADEQTVGAEPQPSAGAELVAELKQSGLIGMWADRTDIGDSVDFARRLRERAQTRADRFDADEIKRLGGAHPAGTSGG
jgi:hypothetical protein